MLAWGGVNAKPPAKGGKQVEFKLDYSGGYGKYGKTYWKTFGTTCQQYNGPPLAWLVKACKAPDGSFWALQAWQRELNELRRPVVGLERREGAAAVALDRRTARPQDHDRPGQQGPRPPVRHLHVRRQRRLRLLLDVGGRPERQLRPQHLRRYLRLRVRLGLEAGKQLPHPRDRRKLLLPVRQARGAPARRRREVPRLGDRPRRHPRRDVVGQTGRHVRRGPGRRGRRDQGDERPRLQAGLNERCSNDRRRVANSVVRLPRARDVQSDAVNASLEGRALWPCSTTSGLRALGVAFMSGHVACVRVISPVVPCPSPESAPMSVFGAAVRCAQPFVRDRALVAPPFRGGREPPGSFWQRIILDS